MQGNSRGCALNNYCMPISYWFAQLKIHGVPAMCQTLSQTLETEQQPDSRPGLLWSLHSRVESWKEYGKKGEGERDGRVELPGHTGTPCLRTYEVPDCFPKGLHHFASLQQSMWVPISLHSRQHLLLSDFQKITIMNLIFKLIYLLLKQNHR